MKGWVHVAWVAGVVSLNVGCNNFDALVERCQAEGRCGQGGEGGGASGGAPKLTATPASLDFSLVSGEVGFAQRVTIANGDGGVANSLAINLSGTDSSDFSIVNACGTTLSGGQSCPVDITFNPKNQTVSLRSGVLEIRAANASLTQVALKAAITGALEVPALADFGDLQIATSKTLTVTIRNLSAKAVSVVPTAPAPFVVEQNDCSTVAGMQSCLIRMRVQLTDPGVRNDVLQLSLFGTSVVFSVNLRARGVTPGVLVIEPADLYDSSNETEFVGASNDRLFTVRNTGVQTIGSIALSVPVDAGFWLVDAGCDGPLDAGDSCAGVLRFAPTALAVYPLSLVADAGAAGTAQLDDVAYAKQMFAQTVRVTPANSGVVSTPSSGNCSDQCTTQVLVDVRTIPTVVASAQRTDLFDFGAWSNDCEGSATTPCSVKLDRARTLAVVMNPVAIGFVSTGQLYGSSANATDVCNAEAADAGLPGLFRPLLVLDGGGYSSFPAGRAFARPDGLDLARVLVPGLRMPFTTARGEVPPPIVWSGLDVDGGLNRYPSASTPATCGAWNTAGGYGGTANVTGDTWWASASGDPCSGSAHSVVCLSTAWGEPLTNKSRVPTSGALFFVANARNVDGGEAGRAEANYSCGKAAEALGRRGDAGFLYESSESTSAVSLFQSGALASSLSSGALVRLDGRVLSPDAGSIRTNWNPLIPVLFAVFPDGGVGGAAMPVTTSTSTNFGSYRSQTYASGSSGCSNNPGSALSVSEWWGPSNAGYQSCDPKNYWVYCVVVP